MSRAMGDQQVEALRAFPVSIETLDPCILNMDLYLKAGRQAPLVLYRSVGIEFALADRQKLIEQGVRFLYVPFSQHAAYRRTLVARLDRQFQDPTQARAARVHTVREACSKMVEDVLLFPDLPEAVDIVVDISQQFVKWAAQSEDEFSYLLDMSAHDYYTVTHMVNVGVGCGMLVRDLYPQDLEFQARAIQGGLLHDVGKRAVPETILNKDRKLDAQEWAIMKKHPQAGYQDLQKNPNVPLVVLEMARNHHERLDGKGYPRGLSGTMIPLPARICAIIDVYDAVTAARSYRSATPPQEALRILREGAGTQFDSNLLEMWAARVEQLLEADPQRAPDPAGFVPTVSIGEFLERPPADPALASSGSIRGGLAALWSDERRTHERHRCHATATVKIIRLGKPCPIGVGETAVLETVDISRSGLQLRTPWALSINDVVEVELYVAGGARIRRRAVVMRVRHENDQFWLAGMRFVNDEARA